MINVLQELTFPFFEMLCACESIRRVAYQGEVAFADHFQGRGH